MLCCVGDLVEDVVVWPTAAPERGTDTTSRVFRRRGGSAANVAVFACEAGGRSRFVGQVGADALGTTLVAEMEATGVDTKVVRDGRTGTIVVLIEPDGERTMLPDRGAATNLATIPEGATQGVTWLHIPAYSLIVEPLATTTIQLIEDVRRQDGSVSLDASSTGLLRQFGRERFLRLVAELHPDVLFCNRDEASFVAAVPERPVAGASLTVIKDGPNPVHVVARNGLTSKVPVAAVANVVDSTGAGDAFAAGFIVATMRGDDPVAAVAAGNTLAASVLTRPGAGGETH